MNQRQSSADEVARKADATFFCFEEAEFLIPRFDGYERPEQILVTYSEMDHHNFRTVKLAFCQ